GPPSEREREWGHASTDKSRQSRPKPRRLSYNEQRELDALPERIAALERERDALQAESASADFYKASADRIHAVLEGIERTGHEPESALARWLELEDVHKGT